MIRPSGVIYVLKEKLGGRDRWERIANTRAEFMRIGGEVIEPPTVEENPTSRQSMLDLIKLCSRRRQEDLIIAVSTWKEVANLDVARAIIEGGFSVIVADLAQNFHLSIEEEPGFVFRGPVMEHLLEMNRKLRAYVDGKKTERFGAVNEKRARSANAFALNIWPAIEHAAEEAKTTNQSEIAAILGSQGLKSIMGSPIRQAQISSYIMKAGRKAEWAELRRRFPKKVNQASPIRPIGNCGRSPRERSENFHGFSQHIVVHVDVALCCPQVLMAS